MLNACGVPLDAAAAPAESGTPPAQPPPAPLVDCLFGLAADADALPPEVQETLLAALGQLMMGFPAAVHGHLATVRLLTAVPARKQPRLPSPRNAYRLDTRMIESP